MRSKSVILAFLVISWSSAGAQAPEPRPRPRPAPRPATAQAPPAAPARIAPATLILDVDEPASISINGETGLPVAPSNVARLVTAPGAVVVQVTSRANVAVFYREVVDIAAGATKVMSVRLKPIADRQQADTLIGRWTWAGSTTGTYTNSTRKFTAEVKRVLTATRDGDRLVGRLTESAIYKDENGGFLRDLVADVALTFTNGQIETRVLSAEQIDIQNSGAKAPPDPLPAASLSLALKSPQTIGVSVIWSSGDEREMTLQKQTTESLAR